MLFLSGSRHKEWRKRAKKERRRRIRIGQAKSRDRPDVPPEEYQQWLQGQEALELFELEHIEKCNAEEHRKWILAEKIAMEEWRILQKMLHKRLEQEAKLKMEWELAKERMKQEEERLKEIVEEKRKKQELFMKHMEEFLTGDSEEPPAELLVSRETKPECEPCPFFSKTACCRFGDQCSRNHKYPGISKILLATNFYSHFGLDNANANEYDTDVMLEFEESDTYREFKEFILDILPEFQKFGRIEQIVVCNNFEKHLRGNTYVEYSELRCAVAAYRALHSRWYGGKQLSLQFCNIMSWKNAICGLQSRKRCPKGRACNFLHVFRNPNNLFRLYDKSVSERSRRSPLPRSWRWSESPEVETPRRRCSRSRSRDRIRRREEKRHRDNSRRKENSSRHAHRQSSDRRRDRKSESP